MSFFGEKNLFPFGPAPGINNDQSLKTKHLRQ